MTLLERLGEIYRFGRSYIDPGFRQLQFQREMEARSARNFVALYVSGERDLANIFTQFVEISHLRPVSNPSILGHVKYQGVDIYTSVHDALLDTPPDWFLETFPNPEKRKPIMVEAVIKAGVFWEAELQRPDLEEYQRLMGQRRQTQLITKLAKLTRDSSGQAV